MNQPTDHTTRATPAATCMHCGYDMRGSSSGICPECGRIFDPAKYRRQRWRSRLIVPAVMAVIMYAPFGWLFFIQDDPRYVRGWMKLGPILPGLVPSSLLAAFVHRKPVGNAVMYLIAGGITLAALIGFTWLGRRGRVWFVIAAIVLLALSSLNSLMALQLFRM